MASVVTEQPQQEQHSEVTPVGASDDQGHANTIAPTAPTTFLARRKKAMAYNIGTRGKFIVMSQLCMALGAIWSAFGLFVFWGDQASCQGALFSLKSWFLGAFVVQCAYILCFLVTMCAVIYFTYTKAAREPIVEDGDVDIYATLPVPSDCFMRLSVCFVALPPLALLWLVLGLVAVFTALRDEQAFEACSYGNKAYPFLALLLTILVWCFGTWFILDAHGARWYPQPAQTEGSQGAFARATHSGEATVAPTTAAIADESLLAEV